METKQAKIEFEIPSVPPSVNHAYGQARYGRRYIKKAGKEFKATVTELFNRIDVPKELYTGRIKIKFIIYFGTRRKRDLDNCMKILWDSLEGNLFENDAQIDEYTVMRAYDKEQPRIQVFAENIM